MSRKRNTFEGSELSRGHGGKDFRTTEEKLNAEALQGVSGGMEGIAFHEAREILGDSYFGPEEIEKVFGCLPESIPPIPFSREELERAKESKQELILQVDEMQAGKDRIPLTIMNLQNRKTKQRNGKQLLCRQNWYKDAGNSFYSTEVPKVGWRLSAEEQIMESFGQNFFTQTDTLISALREEYSLGTSLPPEYREAIKEYTDARSTFENQIAAENFVDFSRDCSKLKITHILRESAIEVIYRLTLKDSLRGIRLLNNTDTWTRSFTGASFITVGKFNNDGIRIDGLAPHVSGKDPSLGVCFSRT